VPGPKRGDVLREFSRLLLAHSDEIADQIIRETGSIRAKAQWEVQMAAREFLEAAALGSQPRGILAADLEAGVRVSLGGFKSASLALSRRGTRRSSWVRG
jgi:benzaldehyde dehydrogenase (NAD)